MLLRNLDGADDRYGMTWDDLVSGAPTIIALAKICSIAFADPDRNSREASDHARAILLLARKRGVIEIRNNPKAFGSVQRFLAVHVEIGDDEYMTFKQSDDPEQTVRFMEAFRQLCTAGLVMHQGQHEFSLTAAGFELARSLSPEALEKQLEFAVATGRQE